MVSYKSGKKKKEEKENSHSCKIISQREGKDKINKGEKGIYLWACNHDHGSTESAILQHIFHNDKGRKTEHKRRCNKERLRALLHGENACLALFLLFLPPFPFHFVLVIYMGEIKLLSLSLSLYVQWMEPSSGCHVCA